MRLPDLLADETHPGWRLFRWGFAAAGIITWLTRLPELERLFAEGAVFVEAGGGALRWSAPAVWAWALVLFCGMLLVGMGKRVRLGAALFLVAQTALRNANPMYYFMYDQLMMWQAIGLLFHPAGDGREPGSPLGRQLVTLTYVGLYAGTGLSKIGRTSGWWSGTPLASYLVDSHYAGGELARWISAQPALLAVMGTTTILFEAGFALALLHPWTRRAWLVAGLLLHAGILALMEVHTFSLVAVAAYPLLLDAPAAAWLDRKVRR